MSSEKCRVDKVFSTTHAPCSSSSVKDHYNSENLTRNIKTALIKAGKSLSNLELKDLAPIDQLHTGGIMTSMELIKKANLSCEAKVLDAGCGIGGSSRLLAGQFKFKVTGIDIADKFIEAANFLTKCTRLEDKLVFRQGSVLDLPFSDNTFDAVLCQHILMNIEDKSTAFKEFYRVLKNDGKLILHEITRGKNDSLLFPVPWAGKASISFLESWDTISTLLEKQGFETRFHFNGTEHACSWWEKVKAVSKKASHTPRPIGPGLVFGNNAKYFGKNMHANFKNNSICLVEAILKKNRAGIHKSYQPSRVLTAI
ncbi:MAG: class I SAM-dependent methyltransferase [Deltaproteobacteria bacterium]|nr:class I SAM-dependent methyltransferase [Deltaproteobacteria bacterium]